jgi:hypothetical protein
MESLAWLANHRLESVERRVYPWNFTFSDQVTLGVECLWRLLENGRIVLTSCDHEQKFGLSSPVDAAFELNGKIANGKIESVELEPDTLDLTLVFTSGHRLEIIPDSSGYEAWQLVWSAGHLIAMGGGELAKFGSEENRV